MSVNTPNPGKFLAERREFLQLTQEKVAAQLHFPIRIIRDLEANNYPRSSPMVFMKGYLRSYGRLLQVPEKKLAEHFELFMKARQENENPNEQMNSNEILQTKSIPERNFDFSTEGADHLAKKRKIKYLIVCVVIVLAIFLLKDRFHPKSESVNGDILDHQQVITIKEPVIATTDGSNNG